MYFEKERVKRVFVNLSERFSTGKILFDMTSSWMCKNSHRHDTVKHTNAPVVCKQVQWWVGWGNAI
jgi:O-methyltransferase involved in polyketide biosynthesis